MPIRLFVACIVLVAPVAAFAAPVPASAATTPADDNPYKKAQVGDFATFKMSVVVAGMTIDGAMTLSVTAKSDKEVTLKTGGTMNGMDLPVQEQKLDLSKPFDIAKFGQKDGAGEMKFEKGKEGKEKIKIAGKEYDAVWTNYKIATKTAGMDVEGEMKVWTARGIPAPFAKIEMTQSIGGMTVQVTMELSEIGNKK